jgi:hypothetical protein
MPTKLRHDHELLLHGLESGKLPRNLHWQDVIDLIEKIGEVEEHGADEFIFAVEGKRALFKRPHDSQTLDVEEASRLRKFLKQDEAPALSESSPSPSRTVVVVDHHGAHLYSNVMQSNHDVETNVKPYDPFHFQHHLIHRKEAHYRGERVPEEGSFYEEIAKRLVNAQQIVLVGHGKGKSSALDYLAEFLKLRHFATFQKVIAKETVDLSALTGPELQALARKHLAGGNPPSTTKTDRYDRPHRKDTAPAA